ncbi:MAG: cellulose binding domain-containing protein, partial [Acidimicrobiales bacterium]
SVSLTLPVLPTGLTPDGLAVVRSARDAGVDLSVVNVMAMDYGDWAAPNPAGRMGQYAIDAATSLKGQLQSLYPGKTPAQLWRMVGITPMIGQNDVRSEVFTLADADRVLTFARQQHVGRLSMWSVARDQQCPGGTNPWADPTCSGILQARYAFSSAFRTFTG